MTTDAARLARLAADPAIVRLWRALTPLDSVVTMLSTGAHPDDETSAMLAALSLGRGVHVAYACATRGEGGQNALGTEAGADLGALRTREMEGAAAVLDMTLAWLGEAPDDPITDFGFSKTAEETFGHWGREHALERLVRIVRELRPDIVCPTFLDVSGQHGHHRAMTRAAREAIALAADPAAFPEHAAEGLAPWQVAKLYLPAWSGAGDSYDDDEPPPNATVTVDAGGRDPVTGASFAQLAQLSRSRHRTQGMGRWVEPGPSPWPLHRAWAAPGLPDEEADILDGLPRRVGDLARRIGDGRTADRLYRAQAAIDDALAAFPGRAAVAAALVRALAAIREAAAALPADAVPQMAHRLARKERELGRALAEASALQVRLTPRPAVVAAGARLEVEAWIDEGGDLCDQPPTVDLEAPADWTVTRRDGGFTIAVPADAAPVDAYPARWSPLDPGGPVRGRVRFSVGGEATERVVPTEEPVAVVPAIAVAVEPERIVVNTACPGRPVELNLAVAALGGAGAPATLAVRPPEGWRTEPNSVHLEPQRDGSRKVRAVLTPERAPAPGRVALVPTLDGIPATTVTRTGYDHTGPVVRVRAARAELLAVEAALPEGVRVGYVGGGNDRVADHLAALGLAVERLGPGALDDGALERLDTLVIGIFAFRTRPDLAAAVGRIHAWIRAGGHLVTFYHRPWDGWDPEATPPAFLRIGQPSLRWRVTDQAAAVEVLLPDHPLLTRPNRIGPTDWEGWQKERGLYFAAAWDEAYRPLLSMADPGEAPLQGALLSAAVGRGRHTHTSLVLHTQMDRLVPGAFRLMANLVQPA